MKLSTVKLLSKVIALPLFIATLSMVAPAGAEQIDRSRSRVMATIPSVTDLNLMIPAPASMLPSNLPEESITIEPFWSNPGRNNSTTAVVRERSNKSKFTGRQRGKLVANTNSARSSTSEQPNRNKSTSRRRNLISTNIDVSTETVTRDERKLKSNTRQKIAAISRSPLSGNYLRLVRDPNKGTNDVGNPIYLLEAYVDGQRYQTFDAVSGTATTQEFDRNRGNNFAPLPDGLYNVSSQVVPGRVAEVGKTFIGISPKFETGRNDLGIHLDPSFNKRNGYDGTAGCIGITTAADRDAINEFVTKYHPHNLFVSIMSSEN